MEKVDIGQYKQGRTQPCYEIGKTERYQTGNACQKVGPFNGLQISPSCSFSPWLSGFGFSKTAKGYLCSWMLLASAQLCYGPAHAQITNRVLAKKARRE